MNKVDKEFWMLTLTAIGAVISISALTWAIFTFSAQIELQRDIELNEHISNVKSLKMELRKNIEAMDDLVKQKDKLEKKVFFEELILENIKRSVADGRISNEIIKSNLIVREFDIIGINNFIKFINSPEFSLNPSNEVTMQKQNLFNQLINKTLVEFKPELQETFDLINSYEQCLNIERNIIFCNKVTYIKPVK